MNGRAALVEALTSSQRLGMLGDRPIDEVVAHAASFVAALDGVTGTVLDLGSGGGVPGLVIAEARPDLFVVLVDRRSTRTDHLRRLVGRLGWRDRVEVVTADAAALVGRQPPADAAVARGFGPPLTTLAAATPLVRGGGLVVVSEPPEPHGRRWPGAGVAACGARRRASPDPRVACFDVC